MTAEELVDRLEARRVGPNRWMGRCPAHEDRRESLSISTGRDGRRVIHCFAGCATIEVLRALGLRWNVLFADGPPPSPAELARAAEAREAKAIELGKQRTAERAHNDRERRLEAVIAELGKRLRLLPDGSPSEDAMTRLYHEALAKLPERQMRGEELCRAIGVEEKGPVASGASEVCA